MRIKILIIEDEIIIARYIEQHLRLFYSHIEIQIALSCDEVHTITSSYKPDLILCDIDLQDRENGIELMSTYKGLSNACLIFITSHQSISIIQRAFALEPENYIIKPLDESRLYAGTHHIIQRLRAINRSPKYLDRLNENERKILRLIAERFKTKEIAEKLYLSISTIKNARHRICRKLELEEENNALLTWTLQHAAFI